MAQESLLKKEFKQMILFKRPGKLGEFANARVKIRLEDAQ
jgi:hypothetical protein